MSSSPAPAAELRELGTLAFDELRRGVLGIGRIHLAVAERAFGAVGPGAQAAKAAHHAISSGVYAGIGSATRVLGSAAGVALERRGAQAQRALSSTPGGAALIAAVDGLIGDRLEQEGSALQAPMAIRVAGEPVAVERAALAGAFPQARPRLVVFLHGLMETEFSWAFGKREPYGSALERELDCTPVYLRYNSGLRISENGQALAALLADLIEEWPVEVDEIALVGHSMGGLVARSACHYAAELDARWTDRVRHVVSLGTPHFGAPLEQGVHYAAAALSRLPETRPFGDFLRRRSGGIRDLRQGSLVDEDWRDRDPDALRAAACKEIPLLEGATHCFVTATITRSPQHPVGRLLGDWLVLEPSGSGRGRTWRLPFRAEHGMHIGSTNHFALLNHPAVYERLREWLATPPPR